MQVDYVIGKYIRLSVEDAKSDSLSIENQRLLIDKRIADMNISCTSVMEFVDNGHSGMNFERPAVQELLELVRLGQINCIIVKDLSRFGRDMIDTGYYIERVFPLYRIRFISISDDYDSAKYEGDTGGPDIAFKHLIHEQYSKDLSRKIKAARWEKAIRGELITKNCAFGYKKVGKQLEVDEVAAETVRLIFKLAIERQSVTQIIKRLYNDKHLTPSEYKQHSRRSNGNTTLCLWDESKLHSILENEQYIGTYIAGKTKKKEIGGKNVIKVPKAEWIRIPNHHPAIIEKSVFDEIQERMLTKGETLRSKKTGTSERYSGASHLKGKVLCGCCGHKLRRSTTKNEVFCCYYSRAAEDLECHGLKIAAIDLESIVLSKIHEEAKNTIGVDYTALKYSKTPVFDIMSYEQMEVAKRELYESFVLDEISLDAYMQKKAEYDTNQQWVACSHVKSKSEANDICNLKKKQNSADNALKEKKLTAHLVDERIDKVLVYPNNRVEIIWKSFEINLTNKKKCETVE